MERRLAAILAADIVDYSRLMGKDEAAALKAVKRLREHLLEPEVQRWRGMVVKRLGDGWLTEFASVADAVNCAVSVQERVAAEPVDLRIGVHVGDIVHAEGDIYGSGVNIASRLEAICQAGFVAISGDAMRLSRGAIETPFHANGAAKLKNIDDSIEVWSWPKRLSEFAFIAERSNSKPHVFVADFEFRGEDSEEMAHAICGDLRTSFSRQSGLVLVTEPKRADFLLEGTVRGQGERWRIGVQLSDQEDQRAVWSERFDEAGEDFFELQDRCASRIAGAVRIRLPELLAAKSSIGRMEDMNKEQLLNLAMKHNFTPTVASWETSRRALELVLDQDAENWMAMTMLCFNRIATSRIFGWKGVATTDAALAKRMIAQASKIKPSDHVVSFVRGAYYLYAERDRVAARIELEESLKLNPIYYHAIDTMSQVELFDCEFEKARGLADRALDCDSAYPYRHLYHRDAGYTYLMLREYERAIDHFQRADRGAPELPWNLIGLSVTHQLAGDADRARRAIKMLLEAEPNFDANQLEPFPFKEMRYWEHIFSALSALSLPR